MRPTRQFAQVGGEIFGAENIAADVEVLTVAAHALMAAGVKDLTIDLVVPALVPAICRGLDLSEAEAAQAREALQAKDIGGLDGFEGEAGRIFRSLLALAGPAEQAVQALADLSLPDEAAGLCRNLTELVTLVADRLPDVSLTVDPGEYLSFEYHTGIAFSFFTRSVRSELGRGGRYVAGEATGRPEPAVGFTAFLDTVMRAVPGLTPAARAYLPVGEDARLAERLRADGWQVIEALDVDADAEDAARRLGCSHIISSGETLEISSG
jgi:ATP phosphoribosyltransferase regulatory subunit